MVLCPHDRAAELLCRHGSHNHPVPDVETLGDRLDLSDRVVRVATTVLEHGRAAQVDAPPTALSAASLMVAARLEGQTIDPERLVAAAGHEVLGAYRALDDELGFGTAPHAADTYLNRFMLTLGFGRPSAERCRRFIQQAREAGADRGMRPRTLAACTVYVVGLTDENAPDATQYDIQEATGVSPTTIRNNWRRLAVLSGVDQDVLAGARRGLNGMDSYEV